MEKLPKPWINFEKFNKCKPQNSLAEFLLNLCYKNSFVLPLKLLINICMSWKSPYSNELERDQKRLKLKV